MCLDNPPCDINAIDKVALVTNTQHIAADGGLIETSLMFMRLKTYRTNNICLIDKHSGPSLKLVSFTLNRFAKLTMVRMLKILHMRIIKHT